MATTNTTGDLSRAKAVTAAPRETPLDVKVDLPAENFGGMALRRPIRIEEANPKNRRQRP
jgi:hypothetical protein